MHQLTLSLFFTATLMVLMAMPHAFAAGGRMLVLEDTPPLTASGLSKAESTFSPEMTVKEDDSETPPPSLGAGCDVPIGSAAVGADIGEAYFGPEPSTVNPSLIGSLLLMTAGEVDTATRTVTLPLYRGEMADSGENVWYVVTDTTDRGNATALGLNFSGKLHDLESHLQKATLSVESSRHESLQNLLIGLSLSEEPLHQVQQLTQGIAGEGMELLTEGLLMMLSKGKPVRFFATRRGSLKERLRYTT
jgi:hypothetical protein